MSRYIDADAFVERLKFKRDTDNINRKKYAGLECAIAQCNKFPTADVEDVRHGEWLIEQHPLLGDHTVTCSCCGRREWYGRLLWRENLTNYCPNCGAKMKVERSENGK